MKKHFLCYFTVILLIFVFLPSLVFSQDRIFDHAGLLNTGEIAALEARAAVIKTAYDFNVVIVTETTIGDEDPMDYADDFFDYGGFAEGEGGALLLQATEYRDWHISTWGLGKLGGETIFSEYALDKTEKNIVSFLGNDNPAGAYNAFFDDVEKYLGLAAAGRHFNFFTENIYLFIIGSWVLALLVAWGIVSGWKRMLNTAVGDPFAHAYITPGSLQFSERTDTFLYSVITKTARPKDNDKSGSSHTSSSGNSHGGRGGKY
jgi:uncharacterized protein